ncbi:MAG: hypothetical protein JWO46_1266 [Nocardioidaceae bacterium]|nr:hypothetical protein [Nocardioidaceae bacterium]
MSEAPAPHGRPQEAGEYEIRLLGHLDARWCAWFDGLALTRESDGSTVIRGLVVDQAALHGLLQKARDTGLPLVSMTRLGPDRPAARRTHPETTHQGDPR